MFAIMAVITSDRRYSILTKYICMSLWDFNNFFRYYKDTVQPLVPVSVGKQGRQKLVNLLLLLPFNSMLAGHLPAAPFPGEN